MIDFQSLGLFLNSLPSAATLYLVSGADFVRNLHYLPIRSRGFGARRGSGPKIDRQNRGRIYLFISPPRMSAQFWLESGVRFC